MTYGHLRADCLYTGISSGPNARYRVWESLYLYMHMYPLQCFDAVGWVSGRSSGFKKTEWWGVAWLPVWSKVQNANDLHIVQLMPLLPSISCFVKIQICLTFLVPAYPDCPGKEAVKRLSCLIHVHVASWTVWMCRRKKTHVPDSVSEYAMLKQQHFFKVNKHKTVTKIICANANCNDSSIF